MKEVSVLGIAFDEANDVAAVILSREGEKNVVPIPIEINEGITVIRLLQKRKMPRPMTHDLLMNIIGDLHHRVHKIEIDLADTGTYTASVQMSQLKEKPGTEPIFLDARPFDAIAIAIKSDAPMFMSESAYDANSVPLVVEKKSESDEDTSVEGEQDLENSQIDPEREAQFKEFLRGLKASDFNTLARSSEPEDKAEETAQQDKADTSEQKKQRQKSDNKEIPKTAPPKSRSEKKPGDSQSIGKKTANKSAERKKTRSSSSLEAEKHDKQSKKAESSERKKSKTESDTSLNPSSKKKPAKSPRKKTENKSTAKIESKEENKLSKKRNNQSSRKSKSVENKATQKKQEKNKGIKGDKKHNTGLSDTKED